MSAPGPPLLPPLKPENAAKAARVLVEAGLPVSALKGVLTGPEVAQVEAAMTAPAGGVS
jgi:hypothetical protein